MIYQNSVCYFSSLPREDRECTQQIHTHASQSITRRVSNIPFLEVGPRYLGHSRRNVAWRVLGKFIAIKLVLKLI